MHKKRAFTLIELLVVIAIIALLMSILMPALRAAREQGARAACLSNLKQLTMAWIMYADDNGDKIVGSNVGYTPECCGPSNPFTNPCKKCWVDWPTGGTSYQEWRTVAIY
jgi:prepilin-type N-terminal cleavage/methylation domain-containing protein